jgi:hypothetical protein
MTCGEPPVGARLCSTLALKSSGGNRCGNEPLLRQREAATGDEAMGRGIYISLGGLILLIIVIALLF